MALQQEQINLQTSNEAGFGVFQNTAWFDAAIKEQSYLSVTVYKSIKCGCKARQTGFSSSYCKTCNGFGLFFVEPNDTNAIIQNIGNFSNQDKGNLVDTEAAKATFLSDFYLSELDKIVVKDSISIFNQTTHAVYDGTNYFAALIYEPLSKNDIEYIGYYSLKDDSMVLLNTDQYDVDKNKIIIKNELKPTKDNLSISIRYRHSLTFLVDRVVRSESRFRDASGKSQKVAKFAMLKKLHNFDTTD